MLKQLDTIGIRHPMEVHRNLEPEALIQQALDRGEAELAANGALNVRTTPYTGRSAKDKFIVEDSLTADQIWWGPINQPMAPEVFDRLYDRVMEHLMDRELFVFDGFAGADERRRLPIRVINELAWQNLFVQQLFIRPTARELRGHQPEFTVISAPSYKADPEVDGTRSEVFIILSLSRRVILIGGTEYGGEIKKSVFTLLNFLLPQNGELPMHCSANVGVVGDVALFFGLSGTGKTTLSSDPERRLIGDDEHGWTDDGVYNFEGGCYAKAINLDRGREPLIYDAIRRGAVMENVVLAADGRPDYDDNSITENTRVAYPIDFIDGAVIPGVGGHPSNIIFLTADAFGVMPPIARLTREQAMYYFLSGYTSKLAGTERGVTVPQAVFSACFGAPFLPLHPTVYANLLGRKMEQHSANVWMINTGWAGGVAGEAPRIRLSHTRAMVKAALSGALDGVDFSSDPVFRVAVPGRCPGVPEEILQPRNAWQDEPAYCRQAIALAERFIDNARQLSLLPDVADAGPRPTPRRSC